MLVLFCINSVIFTSSISAADVDFDSSPINMTFAPEDKLACGTITVFDDAKLGESREVFAVSLLLPAEVPNVEFGAVRRTTVEVTDTPGKFL